jgi:hypothetical protein
MVLHASVATLMLRLHRGDNAVLQILGWLACIYLVIKGVEILQIGLASVREGSGRSTVIAVGAFSLAACVLAAIVFVWLINAQAGATGTPPLP